MSYASFPTAAAFDGPDKALAGLLAALADRGYRFVTTTPATHERVLRRRSGAFARSIEDVFGWSMPFEPGLLPDDLRDDLFEAGLLDPTPRAHRSLVRISSIDEVMFLHSAFPTTDEDAVFFGPDSYRFAGLIRTTLAAAPLPVAAAILDIGTGAGVGAIEAAVRTPDARVVATDVNPAALRFARINAHAAGVAVDTRLGDGAAGAQGPFDLILLNPPYLLDEAKRAYRHGGGLHGAELPLRLTRAALALLAPGGRLILYTGSAIVDGADRLGAELAGDVEAAGFSLVYREIDPDVFGEELDAPGYGAVDRIALVAAIVTRPAT